MTVYPLLQSTSKVLLQETPSYILSALKNDLSTVLSSVSGIVGYREAHFWESEPGKLIGSVHIQIGEDADEQQLLSQIHSVLKQRFGFQNEGDLTIQFEKQSYLDSVDPIHSSVYAQIIPIRQKKAQSVCQNVKIKIDNNKHTKCSHPHHGHDHHKH